MHSNIYEPITNAYTQIESSSWSSIAVGCADYTVVYIIYCKYKVQPHIIQYK